MGYPLNLYELYSLRLRLEIGNNHDGVFHFSSQEGKWQYLSSHKLSLAICPSSNNDWYLRSWWSVIQIFTLEFKISLTLWEVSTVIFCLLMNLRTLGISKTIAAITLKKYSHRIFFFFSNKQTKLWSCGQAQSGSLQESSLKSLENLLSLWVSLGLLSFSYKFIYLFFSFIFISWRLITLHYYTGFCHTLTWISHGFTCVPHPEL